jgi:hypothetical protein
MELKVPNRFRPFCAELLRPNPQITAIRADPISRPRDSSKTAQLDLPAKGSRR